MQLAYIDNKCKSKLKSLNLLERVHGNYLLVQYLFSQNPESINNVYSCLRIYIVVLSPRERSTSLRVLLKH